MHQMEDISPKDFMEILLGHGGGGRVTEDVERQEISCYDC